MCVFTVGDPESVAGEYGRHSLYKMLGYFSLVGLLRLHSLLGDYYQAIKVLENIELNKKVIKSSGIMILCWEFICPSAIENRVCSVCFRACTHECLSVRSPPTTTWVLRI